MVAESHTFDFVPCSCFDIKKWAPLEFVAIVESRMILFWGLYLQPLHSLPSVRHLGGKLSEIRNHDLTG